MVICFTAPRFRAILPSAHSLGAPCNRHFATFDCKEWREFGAGSRVLWAPPAAHHLSAKSAAVNAIGASGTLSILRSATATMRDIPSANAFSIRGLSARGGNQKCCSNAERVIEHCVDRLRTDAAKMTVSPSVETQGSAVKTSSMVIFSPTRHRISELSRSPAPQGRSLHDASMRSSSRCSRCSGSVQVRMSQTPEVLARANRFSRIGKSHLLRTGCAQDG